MDNKSNNTLLNKKKGLRVWLVKEIFGLVLSALVLFLPAGSFKWGHGWMLMGGFVFVKLLGDAWLLRAQPDLLVKRITTRGKANKPWDRLLAPLVAFSSLGISIVAGLDERFGWSSFGQAWALWLGLGLLLLGSLFIFWAMASNPFFDGTVNIQAGHSVASKGPYGIMRHPGYFGIFLVNLSIPLVLDSEVAYIATGFFIVVLLVRTALEDHTLLNELPGYAAYAEKTRHRLFPNIW